MLKKTIVIMALLASPLAFAETRTYFGGSYVLGNISAEGISSEASVSLIAGRLGMFINDNVSIEARLGIGVGDDTVGTAKVEVTQAIGFYARAGMPVNEMVYPYLLLGVTDGETKVGDASASDSDMSYGVGVDIDLKSAGVNLGTELDVNLEYASYYDRDGITYTGIAIGVAQPF